MFIKKQSYRKIFVMFSLNLPKFETLLGLLLLQILGLKTIFHQIAKLQIKFRAYSRETIRYKIYQANHSNQTKIFITSSNVRRTFKRGAINYPQKVALKQVRAAAIIGVGRIFDLRGGAAKPKITYNDVVKNFRKRNFLWDKDIIEWKPRSRDLVYQS